MAVTIAVIPQAIILVGIKKGEISDFHVRKRHQRLAPLGLALISAMVGVGIIIALGAPAAIVALAWALLAGLLSTTAITIWWKISFHAAVSAGAVAIGTTYSLWFLIGIAVVGLIAWSRVVLRDHTPAQVIVGALWGALVCGSVFTLSQ